MAAIGPPILDAVVKALTILIIMLLAFCLVVFTLPRNSVLCKNTSCTDLNITCVFSGVLVIQSATYAITDLGEVGHYWQMMIDEELRS